MPEGFKAKVDELAGHMFNMMWSLTQMDIESTLGNNQTNKQVSASASVCVCVCVCVCVSFRIFHYYERFFVLFYAVLYVYLRCGMICLYK